MPDVERGLSVCPEDRRPLIDTRAGPLAGRRKGQRIGACEVEGRRVIRCQRPALPGVGRFGIGADDDFEDLHGALSRGSG